MNTSNTVQNETISSMQQINELDMQAHQTLATEAMLASFFLNLDDANESSESDTNSFVLGYN